MFDHCLYFNSTALARLVEREWTVVYARFGLTPAQGFVLRVIFATPGCLSSQVSEILGIARPTATRLIDALCEKGLVERLQTSEDKREWSVHASRAGQALKKPLTDASAEITRKLRHKLSPALFEAAVTSMYDVRQALD